MRETDISSHPPATFPHSEAPDDATLKKKGEEENKCVSWIGKLDGPRRPHLTASGALWDMRDQLSLFLSLWSLAPLKHEAAHCLPAELQSPHCCQNVCQKTTTAAEPLHLVLLYNRRRMKE